MIVGDFNPRRAYVGLESLNVCLVHDCKLRIEILNTASGVQTPTSAAQTVFG
jgi:hypothetical protein